MYIKIPNNSNKIPHLRREERLSIIDWLIDNTMLTTKQIADLCCVDETTVIRIFNDELKVPFVQTNPVKNEYIEEELLDFLDRTKVMPIPKNERIDNPLKYANLKDLLDDKIFSLKLIKTYFLIRGHNAWWGTWSSLYTQDKSIHLTLSGAKQEAERTRIQGRVFTIIEIPTLCFYTKNKLIFVSGINSNETNPFQYIFDKDFDSIEEFVQLLNRANNVFKYPQFIATSLNDIIYIQDIEANTQYINWKSSSCGTNYLLSFSSSIRNVNMVCLKYVYEKLINILKSQNN